MSPGSLALMSCGRWVRSPFVYAIALALGLMLIGSIGPAGSVQAGEDGVPNTCYATTTYADIGYASGYAYGEGEGDCNDASQFHTLQVCVRVNVVGGPDYDDACSNDAGYSTYYYATISDYVCGQIWIQSRIDGTTSDSYRADSC